MNGSGNDTSIYRAFPATLFLPGDRKSNRVDWLVLENEGW